MTGWSEFTLAMAAFVASHFLPRLGGLRERLIASLGRRAYFSLYGVLSVALLAWVIAAAGRAPHVELWPPLPWTRWAPNLAMPLVFVLAACGIGTRQPHTLGGKRGVAFERDAPGLAAVTRHPLLLALALWALSHLGPNGDLAHVILFGGFAALALAAIPLFDLRARRAMNAEEAAIFFASTRLLRLATLADRQWRRTNLRPLVARAIIGLALWGAALHLHEAAIGVSPLPL